MHLLRKACEAYGILGKSVLMAFRNMVNMQLLMFFPAAIGFRVRKREIIGSAPRKEPAALPAWRYLLGVQRQPQNVHAGMTLWPIALRE